MGKLVWKAKFKSRKAKHGNRHISVRWTTKSKDSALIQRLRKALHKEKRKRELAEHLKLELDALYTRYYDKYWTVRKAYRNVQVVLHNLRVDYAATLRRRGFPSTMVLSSSESEESTEDEDPVYPVEYTDGDDSTEPPSETFSETS
jgi:hypothetical protein